MGAAILLQSLTVESRFCAVVAEAPYSTLREIAYDRPVAALWSGHMAGALCAASDSGAFADLRAPAVRRGPGSSVARRAVAGARTPVLLIFGSHDSNTPPRHARSIYQANPARVTLWEIPNAGHTGAWERPKEFERARARLVSVGLLPMKNTT